MKKKNRSKIVKEIGSKFVKSYKDIERHVTESESHYKSPLNYNVFNQNSNDYISEYKQNIRNINSIVRLKEKEYYLWLKDILHYLQNGVEVDIKNPPSDKLLKDYIFEKDIEIDFIKSEYPNGFKNPEEVFDRCFLILEFLENETIGKSHQDKKNYPEKYYALYHWLLIEMGKEKPFERNSMTDKYDKKTIINFGKNKYKIEGQVFYNTYINIDITNKIAIAKSYGKGYKNKLIEISNNDVDVISHLKIYPN